MRLRKNIVKVLSLAMGLAIGVVLIAKVCYELQYDSYYADRERVYKIMTGYARGDEADQKGDRVSGAVAPGFKDYVPGVEFATRVTPVFENNVYYTQDKNKLESELVLADTSFFDIFNREIYVGDPHKILDDMAKVMVSRSFAEKLGGIQEAVGQTIYNESLPNIKFTVDGVFEDFPRNSSMNGIDILLSMISYNKSSYNNWVGNDRYHGYVKLYDGVDPNTLTDAIQKMQQENQPMEEFEKAGLKLWYYLVRADKMHFEDSSTSNLVLMLSIVALLLIAAASVNYILNTISSVVQRAKEIGVRKCYGAGGGNILALILKEASMHIFISVVLAMAIILGMQGVIEQLLDAPLASLFTPGAIGLAAAVCAVVLLVSGLIPARIFMGIPVSTAFRNYRESKRRWKLLFLGVQFTFTIFLACVMCIFAKQYNMLMNDDLGYEYDNLLVVDMAGMKRADFNKVHDKISTLPEVAASAMVSELPVSGSSGNNVYLPGSETELMNIADQYFASEGAAEVLGIKFIEGREAVAANEVAVSRKFVEKMVQLAGWSDGAVGKDIFITEHSRTGEDLFTICGVYEDYKIGGVYVDERPSVRFSGAKGQTPFFFRYVVMKMRELSPKSIEAVQQAVKEVFPDKNLTVIAYKDGLIQEFSDIRKVKDSILLGGIFSLVISLMGLIGYIKDETQRRSAEMAVRKINGALPGEIVGMFVKDVLPLVLVAVVLGNIAAYVVGDIALQMFPQKVNPGAGIYIVCDILVVAVILATVAVNSLRISWANPVDSLKSE